MALFRACRDYIRWISGGYCMSGEKVSPERKEKCRQELIERLEKLSIRYYEKL